MISTMITRVAMTMGPAGAREFRVGMDEKELTTGAEGRSQSRIGALKVG